MLELLFFVVLIIALSFGLAIFFGAPYVPTLKSQIQTALDLLALKKGQTMVEVGAGDGRVLAAAAERGWHAVGYEINPVLVIIAKIRTRKYGPNAQVIWGNAFTRTWPEAAGVYLFGLQKLVPKVNTKIVQNSSKKVKLASIGFHDKTLPLKAEKNGVFLYEITPQS